MFLIYSIEDATIKWIHSNMGWSFDSYNEGTEHNNETGIVD